MIAAGRAAGRRQRAASPREDRVDALPAVSSSPAAALARLHRGAANAEQSGPGRAAGAGAGSAADPRSPPLAAAPPPRLRLRRAVTRPRTCPPESPPRRGASCLPVPPLPHEFGRRPRDTKERWARGRRRSPGAARRQSACSKFAQLGRLKPEPGAGEGQLGPRRGPEESRAGGQPPDDPEVLCPRWPSPAVCYRFVSGQHALHCFVKILVGKQKKIKATFMKLQKRFFVHAPINLSMSL